MPRGPRLLIDNACYHIYIRGNQKQQIFLEEQDYKAYLTALLKYKKKYDFSLYGFCLMPNHIHIVGETQYSFDISRLMHSLSRAYTAHFNYKYEKVGQLWQGRFKSKVITKDRYLIDCIQYVETNPLRTKLAQSIAEYPWTSYHERVLTCNSEMQLLDNLEL